jgi:hypothetical protein
MDPFVVPTIGFDLLYAFVILRLDRRDLVWINVTANPTAEWALLNFGLSFPQAGVVSLLAELPRRSGGRASVPGYFTRRPDPSCPRHPVPIRTPGRT